MPRTKDIQTGRSANCGPAKFLYIRDECFYFLLILIIRVSRAATELHYIGVVKCAFYFLFSLNKIKNPIIK